MSRIPTPEDARWEALTAIIIPAESEGHTSEWWVRRAQAAAVWADRCETECYLVMMREREKPCDRAKPDAICSHCRRYEKAKADIEGLAV